MTIHGIEITDNMDVKDIIALFNALIIASEITASELDKNHKNYAEISTVSTENLAKYKAVLEAINTLQINATNTVEDAIKKATDLKTEMSKYYSEEYTQTKKNFNELNNGIKSEIYILESTIRSTIQNAVNDVSIDTANLAKIIDSKVQKIDTKKIENFTNSVNKYFENHKSDTAKTANSIEVLTDEIANNKTKLEAELKEYYNEQEKWIKKLNSQKKRHEKTYKSSRSILLIVLAALIVGLTGGTLITKYLTDKQVVIYQDLDIKKLERLSDQENWISSEVLKKEMKNKDTDLNIFTFIPWWIILLFSLILMIGLSPPEDKKDTRWPRQ